MNLNEHFIFILIVFAFFLSSCLTVNSDLRISGQGRGSLVLDYRVSKKAAGIQRDSTPDGRLIPLPLNQNEFRQKADALSGLSITSLSSSEDPNYIYIESVISFDTLQDLSSFLGIPMRIMQEGDVTRLSVTLADPEYPVSLESRNIISSVFDDDTLSLSLTVDGTVTSVNRGQTGPNGRGALFSGDLEDLYGSSGFIWEVEWQ